ncbi:MAG: unspecified kinase or dependent regulatory protein, partial [Verrucomicrobiales bacterium]|nr:unspecified kinase or dependent regulatory protein [Verrucomicrobiales bacterium]
RRADGGDAVSVAGNPKALTCLNAAEGTVLWEVEQASAGDRAVASPALAGNVCYMTMGQGGTGKVSVAVRVTDAKPEVIWQNRKGLPYVPTPLGVGNRLYLLGDGGVLTCLDAADGREIYNERGFADKAYGSPVMAGDRIYCVGRSGQVAVVAAGDEFKKLGEGKLGEATDSTPAIADGKVFFRTRTHLMALPASAKGEEN